MGNRISLTDFWLSGCLGFLVASSHFLEVLLTLNFSLIAWCRGWSLAEQAFGMIARQESLWNSKGGKEQKQVKRRGKEQDQEAESGAGAGRGGRGKFTRWSCA